MSGRREDRFPLLFMVNLDDQLSEKPPTLKATPSERDQNVTRGAATLISHWPQHVHASSRVAFIATAVSLCLLLSVAVLVFYTTDLSLTLQDYSVGDSEHLAACRRDAATATAIRGVYEGADVEATLVRAMFPVSRAWEFFTDEDKFFFVAFEGEEMSADKVCAIQSAAIARPNGTVYLLVLVLGDELRAAKRRAEVAAEEGVFNQRVRVVNVDLAEYLNGTPLKNADREGLEVAELAARLATLWRFGGLSLDKDVVTLHTPRKALRSPHVVYMDVEGHVIGARVPCHAFVFQAMHSLKTFLLEVSPENRTLQYNTRDILADAREGFCRRPHCRYNIGFYRKCPGLKILQDNIVCLDERKPKHSSCKWSTFFKNDVKRHYFQDICGFPTTQKT